MRFRIILAPTFVALSTSAFGAELSTVCKPLFATMEKSLQADHASTTTRGNDTIKGITVGGVNYLQIGGVWKKSPMSVQENLEQSRTNLKNAKEYTCKPMPDSIAGGATVANYSIRTVGEYAVVDTVIAIDKRTGMPVSVSSDIKSDGTSNHYVTQYSYSGIKAPM